MISVSEATAIILSNLFTPAVESIDIHGSVGRVLAESITADRDFPPFNRASMDGIAIHAASFKSGQRQFKIEGIQAAGTPQFTSKNLNSCLEVMTGAMLPIGTDAVIPYEDVEIKNGVASVLASEVEAGSTLR